MSLAAVVVVFGGHSALLQVRSASLRIHGLPPPTVKRSSALWVARTMYSTPGSSSSSTSTCGTLSKDGLLSASWLLSSCSLGSCGLASVVSSSGSLSGSCGSSSAASTTFVDVSGRGAFHPKTKYLNHNKPFRRRGRMHLRRRLVQDLQNPSNIYHWMTQIQHPHRAFHTDLRRDDPTPKRFAGCMSREA